MPLTNARKRAFSTSDHSSTSLALRNPPQHTLRIQSITEDEAARCRFGHDSVEEFQRMRIEPAMVRIIRWARIAGQVVTLEVRSLAIRRVRHHVNAPQQN